MTRPAVSLRDVTKTYGDRAVVSGLSYDLMPGQLVGLVGHNGAGKTTQIKMMLGLLRADGGDIRVLGHQPAHSAAIRRHLGYLPESVQFHLSFTGRETLAFYARLKGLPARGHDALFAQVGLLDAADRAVRGYSKGMRQRLGLAQALLGKPRLLLLDEPTSGLDPALRREFYAIVSEAAAQGATVLLSSHALTELEDRADRMIVVNRGRKIADGSMTELRRMAALPSVIRFRSDAVLPEALATRAGREGEGWRITLAEDEKRALVTAVMALNPQGLTIEDPSLDDVYAHFLNREVPA